MEGGQKRSAAQAQLLWRCPRFEFMRSPCTRRGIAPRPQGLEKAERRRCYVSRTLPVAVLGFSRICGRASDAVTGTVAVLAATANGSGYCPRRRRTKKRSWYLDIEVFVRLFIVPPPSIYPPLHLDFPLKKRDVEIVYSERAWLSLADKDSRLYLYTVNIV